MKNEKYIKSEFVKINKIIEMKMNTKKSKLKRTKNLIRTKIN